MVVCADDKGKGEFGMGFFKSGFGALDEVENQVAEKEVRRFWLKKGASEDFVLLDNDPALCWEHHFAVNGSWSRPECFEPCKALNSDKKKGKKPFCMVCHRYPDRKPYFAGFNTIIRLTINEFEGRDGRIIRYGFQRNILTTKFGSTNNPGSLKKLQRIRNEYGRLKGLVIRATRPDGDGESVGEFEVIEQIEPKELVEWGHKQVQAFVDELNQTVETPISFDDFIKRNPWAPINFEKEITMRSNEELKELFTMPSFHKERFEERDRGFGSFSNSGSNDSQSSYDDDEIPY